MFNYQVMDVDRRVIRIIYDYMVNYDGKSITLEDYLLLKEQGAVSDINHVQKGNVIYLL